MNRTPPEYRVLFEMYLHHSSMDGAALIDRNLSKEALRRRLKEYGLLEEAEHRLRAAR